MKKRKHTTDEDDPIITNDQPGPPVRTGDRVFYKQNGESDTGTIISILIDPFPFVVRWDHGPQNERVDQYSGDQLVLIQPDPVPTTTTPPTKGES